MFTLPLQKKSYVDNSKHLEANTQAVEALGTHLAKNIFF